MFVISYSIVCSKMGLRNKFRTDNVLLGNIGALRLREVK